MHACYAGIPLFGLVQTSLLGSVQALFAMCLGRVFLCFGTEAAYICLVPGHFAPLGSLGASPGVLVNLLGITVTIVKMVFVSVTSPEAMASLRIWALFCLSQCAVR